MEGASNDPPPVFPDTQFLFQNKTTGQASKNHLSTLQLCKMLCSEGPTPTHALVTSATNVLQQLPDGSYVSEWRAASSVPVLREACTQWYAYNTNGGEVGPAQTCRQLASASTAGSTFRYASVLTNSQWMTLEELPHLQLVLDALTGETQTQQREASTTPALSAESQKVQEELRAFLSVTMDKGGDEENEEVDGYQSEGGTRYVKDPMTNRWIHAGLVTATAAQPTGAASSSSTTTTTTESNKRKHKKPKFSAKKGRCWVYATGIPQDATEAEVAERFSKAGLLDLHPETQRPKIKLYREKETSQLKGDGSICYARPESIPLAITLLDGAPFRLDDTTTGTTMTVEPAKFEQHGETFEQKKRAKISNAKRKVAKLATMQAMDWDEGAINGRLTGGRKGLRIIVLQHMFTPLPNNEEKEDAMLQELEEKLRTKCSEWGAVEKITVFASNPDGVVVIKFTQPGAASDAVKYFDGREWHGRLRAKASFWDGVTDFTVQNLEKEKAQEDERHEAFGAWLDNQDLPEELRLQSE